MRARARRLEDHGIAVGERRRGLPGRDRDREVPGGDQSDDPDGLARHLDGDAGSHGVDQLTGVAHGLAGREAQDLARAGDLAHGLGEGLPLLAGEQLAELVLAREDLGRGLLEHVGAHLGRRGRPGGLRLAGGVDGARDGLTVDAHRLTDDVREIGGVDVGDGVAVRDPGSGGEAREHRGRGHGARS